MVEFSVDRKNTLADAEALATLYEREFHPSTDPTQVPADPRILMSLEQRFPGAFTVAYNAGKPVGFAFGFPVSPELRDAFLTRRATERDMLLAINEAPSAVEGRPAFFLSTVYVDPSVQRQGVARNLVKRVVSSNVREGTQLFCSVVSPDGSALMGSLYAEFPFTLRNDLPKEH
jgi:GNAT superfamily N-acetyltransferase